MTARAIITAAAMRRAIEAAKDGVRVEVRPDGSMVLEPPRAVREDGNEFDLVDMRK